MNAADVKNGGRRIGPPTPKSETKPFREINPATCVIENQIDPKTPREQKTFPTGATATPAEVMRDAHASSPERFHHRFHSSEPSQPVRVLRKSELPAYTGLERTAIDGMIERGEFPRPIRLSDGGRAIAWIAAEVAEWQRQRIALRDAVTSAHSDAAK